MDRFWSKVKKSESCWIWTAYKSAKGYGIFQLDGGPKKAHRIAYELVKGPIRKGFELDHLCKNKSCVNPGHLEPVTTRINTRRAPNTIAHKNAMKTHCPKEHELSGTNVLYHDNGYNGARRCRTCKNSQERARDRKKRPHTREYLYP